MIRWLKCLLSRWREPSFVHAAEPIVTDWDVAQAFEQSEPEPGRIEYRFLGVTGEEDA
jgi:hypothetical protein